MSALLTRTKVRNALWNYGKAWETQNPNLILSIFTEDATYQEGPFAEPMVGWDAIRAYWEKKVVQEQRDIRFHVENILIEGNVAVVEWIADFVDVVKNEGAHLYEVAFLEFSGDHIKSLRETWRSERTPL
ncbi:MAG: hypothetical protein A2937_01920 [Candidatus Yonathbacteria bacterium RIFCSPLOWO2_01_FULL_47_33b]|uniref:SnoaL-like domain-containing protein n=1 Tax=Candidatus Yonathbacteria bacterium RIFCSPLOWO2_01_FULL_47_33b TaxID=1802727 RepID=A0A1G2SG82_9BACT|nr:MAG: hypothetical protein A2937_01920 [Candidatus Yonathbacteria bacterium RIFCSPLOWO2_01_FULL_47_33b]